MTLPEFNPEFLASQQDYYRARAPEYDEWWERRGRYDHGPEANGRWFREQEEVYTALARLELTGDVLELACGTGNWTQRLARSAAHVTAVDGSPEMLRLNRERVQSEQVEYVQADLFAWQPERRYDAVVTGFWLSHVPPEQLDPFLGTVRSALVPGGCFFFIDSRRDPLTTTSDQPLPAAEQPWLTRRLNDGREFRIIKLFYDPDEFRSRLEAHGFRAEVRETESFFLYGWAVAK